jgi:hypothetical protein
VKCPTEMLTALHRLVMDSLCAEWLTHPHSLLWAEPALTPAEGRMHRGQGRAFQVHSSSCWHHHSPELSLGD